MRLTACSALGASLAASLLLAVQGLFCAGSSPPPCALAPAGRSHRWAERIEAPGLPNFHKVSEELYRGAQPTAEGFRRLQAMGIKTVVNLRSFHSDRDEAAGTGLAIEHIHGKAWHPEEEEFVRFLRIVTDKTRTPVFVHCQHGADRTGAFCAVYRMAVQGWSKEEAIGEMTEGGFGFHGVWENLVRYLRALDVESLKHKAGCVEAGGRPNHKQR